MTTGCASQAWIAVTLDRFFDEKADAFWFTSRDGESLFRQAKHGRQRHALGQRHPGILPVDTRMVVRHSNMAGHGAKDDRPSPARHTPPRTLRALDPGLGGHVDALSQIVIAAPSRELAKAQLDEWWTERGRDDGARRWPESSLNVDGGKTQATTPCGGMFVWKVCAGCLRKCRRSLDAIHSPLALTRIPQRMLHHVARVVVLLVGLGWMMGAMRRRRQTANPAANARLKSAG